ncbi:MAG: hypothetical protein JNL89_09050 [Rhodanobacteraceae bacterium]|nr:hypothetical protein [Rhodanobacteraceae bacterium]
MSICLPKDSANSALELAVAEYESSEISIRPQPPTSASQASEGKPASAERDSMNFRNSAFVADSGGAKGSLLLNSVNVVQTPVFKT